MGPRELALHIIPASHRDPGKYDGLMDGLDEQSKLLNVVMGSSLLLNILDKTKASFKLHPAIKTEMERLRDAIGKFSDAEAPRMAVATGSASEWYASEAERAAIKKLSKHSKRLVVALLYKPGLSLKGDPGAGLDAAILSMLLTLVDAEMHNPPWDAPKSVIVEQTKANRIVAKKMARLMADASGTKNGDDRA
jgi:hypothetical protein